MVSLAREILLHEWRRFVPAILAIAFSGILVLVQLGLLLGMFSAVSLYIDRSTADLWVGFPGIQSVDQPRPIPETVENRLRMNPQVIDVERYTWTLGDWKRPEGGRLSAVLIGVSLKDNTMTFARLLTPKLRKLLQTPGNVLVDEGDLKKLGVKVGDYTELRGKRVYIAGTVRGMRSTVSANILTSLTTARNIDTNLRNNSADYFLVKIRHPEQAEQIRDELQPEGEYRPFQVWTAQEFSQQSVTYWLMESGAGGGFLFSSILGLIVGIVITSQTLVAAIVAALREYATLRALGISAARLKKVVLEQSFWLGLIGLTLSAITSILIAAAAKALYVSFTIPLSAAIALFSLIMITTLLSGLFALRALNHAEPFTLLR